MADDSTEAQTLAYASPHTPLGGVGIGTIGLQLVGVYCLVQALPLLSVLLGVVGSSGDVSGRDVTQILFGFSVPGMNVVIGLLLIRLAPRLSGWLFRDAAGGIMAGPIIAPVGQYLQAVAFSVAGVLTVVDAAPRLVALLYLAMMDMGSRLGGFAIVVEPILQFLLGLGLFLHSKGLALLWHKIRTGGVSVPQPDEVAVHSDSDKA